MNKIMFSIITVAYNSETTIRDTIESVLNQSYDNYEYLIIDGKSTDSTLDIIKEYEEKFKGKMKYISEPDQGIYDAMNKGISMASGELIGIINSDDWYERNALENVARQYQEYDYTVYYGYMRTVDAMTGKEIRCALYSHEYIREAMINHPTVFVSKKIYDKFGVFDCQYKASADYDFIVRLTKQREIRFVKMNDVQANFRTGGVSENPKALMETMKIKYRNGYMTRLQYIASLIFLYGKIFMGYR